LNATWTSREGNDDAAGKWATTATRRPGKGEFDWSAAQVGIPSPKKQVTILLDADVLDWFKAQGSGYQMRINPVLRHYVETQRKQKKARVSRR
jgi:uncharacterized protein (DUF4415 family)